MLRSPCYIVSDLHLGTATPDVERLFLAFLHALPGRAESLLINGDLFDFWFEWKTVIPRGSFRVLAALAELRERGVEIVWVAGNHDCWGGDVLQRDVGVTYHVGAWDGSIAGWRTHVDHGDGLREVEDRRYRLLRRLLRHPAAIRAFRMLHPDWATRLATGSSAASREHRARDGGAGLRAVAQAHLDAAPSLDLLVYGHSHVAALERARTGGVFANAGSWLDQPTYLRVTESHIELRRWRSSPGSAEGDRLNTLERRAEKALTQP